MTMTLLFECFVQAWQLLVESAAYMLFGLLVSGLLRMFLHPDAVARHLQKGRFKPVLKAALLGVPIPLCSCGVLPAAVALKKQGANKGAVTAFMISTPESGVDSMAVTYALIDPLMTIARPVAAFITAVVAGMAENLLSPKPPSPAVAPIANLSCPVDACCDGINCPPAQHAKHHSLPEKLAAGIRYAIDDLWEDMAGWYLLGLLVAGIISALVPVDFLNRYLGGGFLTMLLMLVVGIPLYICATASTPIAAALILKGISPGAALVFLLAGPATNITSLTVLFGILGRRATAIYLLAIATMAVIFGLAVDQLYGWLHISPLTAVAKGAEALPPLAQWAGVIIILLLSFHTYWRRYRTWRAARHAASATCPDTQRGSHCHPVSPQGASGTGKAPT
jgi:uncharacterized membrane protein YraQ (UPF0718 family)